MHIHFQLAQQCIQISTRINSSSVHTYIFVCSTLRVILQGFVDPIMQHFGITYLSQNKDKIQLFRTKKDAPRKMALVF